MDYFDVWEFFKTRCEVCLQVRIFLSWLSLYWNEDHFAMRNKMGTQNIIACGRLLRSQDEINLPGKRINFIGSWRGHRIVLCICMRVFVYQLAGIKFEYGASSCLQILVLLYSYVSCPLPLLVLPLPWEIARLLIASFHQFWLKIC